MGLGCHCARKTHYIVQLGYEAALGRVGLPGCEMSQLGLLGLGLGLSALLCVPHPADTSPSTTEQLVMSQVGVVRSKPRRWSRR